MHPPPPVPRAAAPARQFIRLCHVKRRFVVHDQFDIDRQFERKQFQRLYHIVNHQLDVQRYPDEYGQHVDRRYPRDQQCIQHRGYNKRQLHERRCRHQLNEQHAFHRQ